MRFEAKNSYFKRLAQSIGNFKNVCKTVAIRHQRLSCYNLANDSNIFGDEIIKWKGLVISCDLCLTILLGYHIFKGKKMMVNSLIPDCLKVLSSIEKEP